MDPTSADAAPGEVVVPTALEPTPPAKDEADTVTAQDHGAMSKQGADAGSAGHAVGGGRDAGTVTASYSCPMHPEVQQSTPGNCPKCGMKLVVKATDSGTNAKTSADSPAGKVKKSSQRYTCPMHPEVESTDPRARCPKCGMKLVPKPADTDASKDSAHGGQERQ